jgi:hypothetical protein
MKWPLRWQESEIAEPDEETHSKAALDIEARAVRWAGSNVLVGPHTGRYVTAEPYADCPRVESLCLATQADATYWGSCYAGNASEATVDFEHVNLVMMSSCYD